MNLPLLQKLIIIGILAVSSLYILLLIMAQYPLPLTSLTSATLRTPLTDISLTPEIFRETININNIIQLQRTRIQQKMKNFEYPSGRFGVAAEKLTDLTPETGGTPIRSVIITTWRSGSTFLGEILNKIPGNYYHYEPLKFYGVTQIYGPPNGTKAIGHLKKLLNCDFTNMYEALKFEKENIILFLRYHHFGIQTEQCPEFCFEPNFSTSYCKLFPLQTMKIVRLRLALADQLLDDTSLNVRILLLVRDPRGTMQSRKDRDWCVGNAECDNASYLCNDLVSDYYAAEILIKKYPSRFRVVRYEDLSISPHDMAKDIIQFYGLPFGPRVQKFLDTHTIVDKGYAGSTFRDSKSAPFHWIKDLQWFEVEEIEKTCAKAMDLWGYRRMNSSKEQTDTFAPLFPPPFIARFG